MQRSGEVLSLGRQVSSDASAVARTSRPTSISVLSGRRGSICCEEPLFVSARSYNFLRGGTSCFAADWPKLGGAHSPFRPGVGLGRVHTRPVEVFSRV
jgi:hypothetical protein